MIITGLGNIVSCDDCGCIGDARSSRLKSRWRSFEHGGGHHCPECTVGDASTLARHAVIDSFYDKEFSW